MLTARERAHPLTASPQTTLPMTLTHPPPPPRMISMKNDKRMMHRPSPPKKCAGLHGPLKQGLRPGVHSAKASASSISSQTAKPEAPKHLPVRLVSVPSRLKDMKDSQRPEKSGNVPKPEAEKETRLCRLSGTTVGPKPGNVAWSRLERP